MEIICGCLSRPFYLWIKPPSYLIGIFTHLKLFLANAIYNFKWVKIMQVWLAEGQLTSNLADWCNVSPLKRLKTNI